MTLAVELVRALDATSLVIPEVVFRTARLHLLDSIGVGLAASGLDVGAPYRSFAASRGQGGETAVFGHVGGFEPATAALINGGLIHSLEYDDTHTGGIVHGSSVLTATALAAGSQAHATGLELVTAYILGWDLLVRMGEAAPGGFQSAGFQVSSVGGALAAAYVAARLNRLDAETTVMAIGIALSQAAGVFEFLSNGSSVKSLHPGWAAHAGVTAAELARHGLTGPRSAIEGMHGLFAVFARDPAASDRFRQSLATLGTEWKVVDAAFKFLPCCHYIHPFVEAARTAMRGRAPAEIATISCRVPRGAARIICEPWSVKQAPGTGHAARWSLPVVVAAQIQDGKVDLDTFARPIRPDILELASRMRWAPLEHNSFPRRFEAELLFTMHDGSSHTERVEDAFGNIGRPASESQVREKFRANAGRCLPTAQVAKLERHIDDLCATASLRDLAASCGGGVAP